MPPKPRTCECCGGPGLTGGCGTRNVGRHPCQNEVGGPIPFKCVKDVSVGRVVPVLMGLRSALIAERALTCVLRELLAASHDASVASGTGAAASAADALRRTQEDRDRAASEVAHLTSEVARLTDIARRAQAVLLQAEIDDEHDVMRDAQDPAEAPQ
jgi:hypothetical protein